MGKLEELGFKYGTDKGTVHSYLDIYEKLFSGLIDKPIILLEIGIAEGRSMRMWREYFPQARLFGMDIDINNCLNAGGIATYINADQSDRGHYDRFYSGYGKDFKYDIIIDDGSHEPERQILSFHYLWQHLNPGGYYCIEDLWNDNIAKYWEGICGAKIYYGHKAGHEDDILVVIQKP